jgi:hypothetical protein
MFGADKVILGLASCCRRVLGCTVIIGFIVTASLTSGQQNSADRTSQADKISDRSARPNACVKEKIINDDLSLSPSLLSAVDDDTCSCFCGGQSWSPGATACMGGFKFRCVDRGNQGTNCGWDAVKQGSDQVPCDGAENCNPQ